MEDLGSHGFLTLPGPTRLLNPNGISSVQPFLIFVKLFQLKCRISPSLLTPYGVGGSPILSRFLRILSHEIASYGGVKLLGPIIKFPNLAE